MLRTTNGGDTWQASDIPDVSSLQGVYFINNAQGWVVGWDGAIYRTEDGGVTWLKEDSGVTTPLLSVFFLNEQLGWAVGHNGRILKYVNDPSYSITVNSPCRGDTLYLSVNGSTGDSYQWSGPNGFSSSLRDPVIPNVQLGGTYSVTVTRPSGTKVTVSVEVVLKEGPQLLPSAGTLDCQGNPVTLSSGFSGSGAGYAWSGPAEFSSNAATPSTTQPGTYGVTVTDAQGCSSTGSVTVDPAPELPLIAYAHPQGLVLNCSRTSLLLVAAADQAGTGVWWFGGQPVQASDSLTVLVEGNYTYRFTSQQGCVAELGLTVGRDTLAPEIEVLQVDSLNCTGDPVFIRILGLPQHDYQWTLPGEQSANGPELALQGPGVYRLVVSAPNGCTALREFLIPSPPGAPTDISVSEPLPLTCERTAAVATVSALPAGLQYAWSDPSGQTAGQSSVQVMSSPGLWQVSITDPVSGCRAVRQVELGLDTLPPPTGMLLLEAVDCAQGHFRLYQDQAPDYRELAWLSGEGSLLSRLDTLSPGGPGTYILELTGDNGCTSWVSRLLSPLDLSVPPPPVIAVTLLDCRVASASLALDAPDPGYTVRWTNAHGQWLGEGSPIQVSGAGRYRVTVSAPNGCSASAEVEVLPFSTEVLPTIITPNGDGRNDQLIFDLCGDGSEAPPRLSVFNRWGQKVHHSGAYANDWPPGGRSDLPAGVYYYLLHWGGREFRQPLTILAP